MGETMKKVIGDLDPERVPDDEIRQALQDTVKPAIRLSIEQQNAVDLCCDRTLPIVGVTGGAGVGKTLVLGEAYRELKSRGLKITLAAPTGRAAKRIQELTGIPAKTVHRLLEFPQPDDIDGTPGQPKRCRAIPLIEDVIIVDESSMISYSLYRYLMDALKKGSCVRFFGDNNQLPPVESDEDKGMKPPFIEILRKFPAIELTFNYRSDDEIVNNANRILRGRIPQRNDRFQILYSDYPIQFLLEFVKGEKIFGQDTHQIIMPTRRGKYGTQRFNPSLQTRFNPRGDMLKVKRFVDSEPDLGIRGGDKFLWIKNDYNLDLFNGEIGRIDWVDTESGELSITTSDKSIVVPPRLKTFSGWHGHIIDYDPRKQIELGYAITTHKSQGSEFDTVIYCITRAAAFLLNRRNFYTAVTRAKRQVIIITDRRAMSLAMRPSEV